MKDKQANLEMALLDRATDCGVEIRWTGELKGRRSEDWLHELKNSLVLIYAWNGHITWIWSGCSHSRWRTRTGWMRSWLIKKKINQLIITDPLNCVLKSINFSCSVFAFRSCLISWLKILFLLVYFSILHINIISTTCNVFTSLWVHHEVSVQMSE